MLYVYVDESGDLGFTQKSTKYYVIATAEMSDPLDAERIIKKARKKLKKKEKNISEFKFSRSSEKIRKLILNELSKAPMNFSTIVLDKRMVYEHLRNKKDILNNYLTGFLVESLDCYINESYFRIVIDKFIMQKEKRYELDKYMRMRMGCCDKNIKFQKYERQIEDYYKLIKPKLRLELKKWF
ncbi:MAG: hypothetical protein PWQ22_528 [Archaeoglobaceae archaeon]|nr:hypothetical protein [Archaeoglobaceae archaeon]MDK2876118.1 hypothetical protein [Archaeoglobaceae archaeon]